MISKFIFFFNITHIESEITNCNNKKYVLGKANETITIRFVRSRINDGHVPAANMTVVMMEVIHDVAASPVSKLSSTMTYTIPDVYVIP